jgi:hypothetical protein
MNNLDHFQHLDPDNAMTNYGKKVTAFIWSASTNTLFCQPGEMSHDTGVSSKRRSTQLKKVLQEPIGSRIFVGRYGETPNGGFVTVWNVDVDNQGLEEEGMDEDDWRTVLEVKVGNMNDLKTMLRSMVMNTAKVVGAGRATYPITEDYVITTQVLPPKLVSDFIGKIHSQEEDDCRKKAVINIDGRSTNFGTLLGNFHMVRGADMDKMRGAICNQGPGLQRELGHCDHEAGTLKRLMTLAKCGDVHQSFNVAKDLGHKIYRDKLRKIFSKPEEIDKEFRTQREIDAAWDYLQKGEARFIGFRNFLNESLK